MVVGKSRVGFRAKVGLGLSKHRKVAKGGSPICIYQDPTCKSYRSSIFLLGGKLVLVWRWFGENVGQFWVKNETILGKCSQGMHFIVKLNTTCD